MTISDPRDRNRARGDSSLARRGREPRKREAEAPAPAVPEDLLRSVVAYFNPLRVILFGSRARGDAKLDSDIDLLVVVDDETPPEKLTLEAGFRSTLPFARAADVVPCRASTFTRRKTVVGTLCHAADAEGVLVYERA